MNLMLFNLKISRNGKEMVFKVKICPSFGFFKVKILVSRSKFVKMCQIFGCSVKIDEFLCGKVIALVITDLNFTEEDLRLPVTKEDYLKHLVEYGMMKLNAAASVKETNQIWVEEDDFQMIMPTVDIQVNIYNNNNSNINIQGLMKLLRYVTLKKLHKHSHFSPLLNFWGLLLKFYHSKNGNKNLKF